MTNVIFTASTQNICLVVYDKYCTFICVSVIAFLTGQFFIDISLSKSIDQYHYFRCLSKILVYECFIIYLRNFYKWTTMWLQYSTLKINTMINALIVYLTHLHIPLQLFLGVELYKWFIYK